MRCGDRASRRRRRGPFLVAHRPIVRVCAAAALTVARRSFRIVTRRPPPLRRAFAVGARVVGLTQDFDIATLVDVFAVLRRKADGLLSSNECTHAGTPKHDSRVNGDKEADGAISGQGRGRTVVDSCTAGAKRKLSASAALHTSLSSQHTGSPYLPGHRRLRSARTPIHAHLKASSAQRCSGNRSDRSIDRLHSARSRRQTASPSGTREYPIDLCGVGPLATDSEGVWFAL